MVLKMRQTYIYCWKNLQDLLLGDKSKLQNSLCKQPLFVKKILIYSLESNIWRSVHQTERVALPREGKQRELSAFCVI